MKTPFQEDQERIAALRAEVERLKNEAEENKLEWYSAVKDMRTYIAEVERLRRVEANLNNLLAVIHRDGGHYQGEHGDEKALADAMKLVPNDRQGLRAEVERLRRENLVLANANHRDNEYATGKESELRAEVERLRAENDMHAKVHRELTGRNVLLVGEVERLRVYLPLARAGGVEAADVGELDHSGTCHCCACELWHRWNALTPEQRAWLMEGK